MQRFRVFIYADGLVLPLVVHLRCTEACLVDRLQRLFAYDLVATRADIWCGDRMIMQIAGAGIAALIGLADQDIEPAPEHRDIH